MKNFIKWLGENRTHRHNLIIRLMLVLLFGAALVYDTPSIGWCVVLVVIITSFAIGSFMLAWNKYKL